MTGFEDLVEEQIRAARESGEFDRLPGVGKPIRSLDDPPDELWWVKQKLRDEGLSLLPGELELRRELDLAYEARTEAEFLDRLGAVNAKIARNNARCTSGPMTTLAPHDPQTALQRWRSRR